MFSLDDAAQCNSKTAEEMYLLSQRRQAFPSIQGSSVWLLFLFFETKKAEL